MADEILKRDQNHITVLGAVTNDAAQEIRMLRVDASTGRLKVSAVGGGSGTVTDVSVVSANGFAGSVATSTTTPAITLSTTITGILKGNGTAISAATAGTDYVTASSTNTFTNKTFDTAGVGNSFSINGTAITSVSGAGAVILANSPVFVDDITLGAAGGATGSILFKGTTSGTVTLKTKDAAGTWTMTLPDSDGDSGQVLSTDGNGILSWASAGGVPTTITVADEATDTSCFVSFFTAATGDLGPKTNANLTFNSNTGVLTSASSILTTTDINGGTIDGTTIGASSAANITGLIITANTSVMPDANDGAVLGSATVSWSDLFLASGAVINFANGDVTITHSSALLTISSAVTLGTSNAFTTGTIELGAASDTTISRSAAGVIAVEGVVIPSISSTNTLTNKRITKRVLALSAGSATPAINTDSYDVVHITAQSAAITSFTSSLTGTPVDGDTLRISITDNGTARALTWGASFEASTVALPTTTVISTRLDVGFFWNTETTKWRCVAVA
jgi:hypothetical protein